MRKEKLQTAEIRWLNQVAQMESQATRERRSLCQDIASRLGIEVEEIVGFREEGKELLVLIKSSVDEMLSAGTLPTDVNIEEMSK